MKYKLPLLAACAIGPLALLHAADKPNIVYILCDDLGYGDVKCLGGDRSKILTPNMDRIASQGMIFTEAHSSSAVCTPSRYSILTGRYNWRSKLQKGVFGGYSEPLIAENRLTVPALLKQNGYDTGCIGKWHLGMTIPKNDLQERIPDGPTSRGFDYYFGISASLDMPPYVFIENDHFTEAPTAKKAFNRPGPAAPSFEAVDVLPTLAKKGVEYVGQHAKTGKPFFLYLPLNSPHTPIVPTKDWQGKSGLGKYGDFVMETDWAIGQLMEALDKAGIVDNTLVIVTSDNGCSPAANVDDLEKQGHFPSELRRGYKSMIWDGGHRIPFIARWPGKVKAGGRSDQIVCLDDLMATCADILGVKLPDNAGEDSVSLLSALLGKDTAPLREAIVHHSIFGNFGIRQGQWKLDLCTGSGGWRNVQVTKAPGQLYDMSKDIGERTDEYAQHPEIVDKLMKLLQKYIADGRSTPGTKQKNDVAVDIYKKNGSKVDESEN